LKVKELEGPMLDCCVAMVETIAAVWNADGICYALPAAREARGKAEPKPERYSPSTDWACGGPIIEREGIELERLSGVWHARVRTADGSLAAEAQHPSALVAAMRAYVASRLGSDTSVPEHHAP
jgi:hypothetical protein